MISHASSHLRHLTSNIRWHTSLLITGVYFLLGGVKSTQLSLWVFTNIEILEFQMRYTFQNFFRTGQPQYPPCPVIEWERQFYPIFILQTHFEFLVQFQSQAAQNIRPIRILCLTLPKIFCVPYVPLKFTNITNLGNIANC